MLTLTIATISCFGGSNGDDDDDNNNDNDGDDLGACCNLENQCSVSDRLECDDDGGRWLGAETLCVPDPCTGDDDDDTGDPCEGNTAPTFYETIWVVNGSKEIYPADATATTDDLIGVGIAWEDAECNLIGGHGNLILTMDGVEQSPFELGPYPDSLGCSSTDSNKALGFIWNEPIPAATYDWIFSATDICGATSEEVSGTFTITE